MLNINELSVSIYLVVAMAVIFLGTKFSMPGAARVFIFATLFSIFFSMGLLVGHGAMPFPGLLIFGSCWYTDSCSKMYGDVGTLLLFTLVPMIVQWIIILAISFVIYHVHKCMSSDRLVSNEESTKHKRIIGIAWLVLGVTFFLLFVLSSGYVLLKGENLYTSQLFSIRTLVALLHITAGYSLLKNLIWARWLCLPLSVLSLFYFPFGTALGTYYLWYYLTIERSITMKPS